MVGGGFLYHFLVNKTALIKEREKNNTPGRAATAQWWWLVGVVVVGWG